MEGGFTMNLGLYEPSDWSIVTSGGGEIDVGLARIFFIGLASGAFYVRQGGGAVQRLPYIAGVGGAGLSVSTGGVITLSGSLPVQPGGGWRVYRNVLRRDSLTLSDFTGTCHCVNRVLAAGFSGSITLAFFGLPTFVTFALPAVALSANAAGILWGTGETSSAGYSGSVISGRVLSPSVAAE